MRLWQGLGLLALCAFAVAAWQGQVAVHLVVILPVITFTGGWGLLAGLLGLATLGAFAWDRFRTLANSGTWGDEGNHDPSRPGTEADRGDAAGPGDASVRPGTERRSGGVILLGPIPIVWGDAVDKRWLPLLALLGLLLVGLWLWLAR